MANRRPKQDICATPFKARGVVAGCLKATPTTKTTTKSTKTV